MTERKDERFWLRLTEDPLSVDEPAAWVVRPECGAVDVFIGTTRRWTNGRETERLSYEAYDEMAVAEMARLAVEAAARYDLAAVAIHHRVGDVPVGEASVVIAASGAHRSDAFRGARELIDRLKVDVPIWKRERFADGTEEWVRPTGD